MKIIETPISDLIMIKPKIFSDNRGYFLESFQTNRYCSLGIPPLVQDNISHSKQNVLRGLHYQLPYSQGKLIWVMRGVIWDVVLDIRIHSATFGQHFGIELSAENHTQLYVPPGFAHGFCVLSEFADIYYKCTELYAPMHEYGVVWNDPNLKISWPIKQPLLSPKDSLLPKLHEIPREQLFT